MKRLYCKYVMCRTGIQQCSHIVSVCHASVVRGCVRLSASSSLIYHFWFLKHRYSAATPHHHRRCWRSCRTNENCMFAEQIIIIFYIFIILFSSMYLVLFWIVLYRTIVTVYTNIFLYNYQRQMRQIIHLWEVGCFTPAWSKTVQKNREVRGVNWQQKRTVDLSEFRYLGDIVLSIARGETTKTNKPQKHFTKTGAITSAVLLRKGGNIPNESVLPLGSKSNKRRLTPLDLNTKVVRLGDGWQVSADQQPHWTGCCTFVSIMLQWRTFAST